MHRRAIGAVALLFTAVGFLLGRTDVGAPVRELADRVTVLRDGSNAGELVGEEITHEAMVRMSRDPTLRQHLVDQPSPQLWLQLVLRRRWNRATRSRDG